MAHTESGEIVNPNGPLPKGIYTVMIQKVIQAPSVKQNIPGKTSACMDLFKLEIVAPDYVDDKGVQRPAAGRTFETYQHYGAKSMYYAQENLKRLGITWPSTRTIPDAEEINSGALTRIKEIQDLTVNLEGMFFEAELWTEEGVMKNADYTAVIDPATGETIPNGRHNIVFDLGRVKSPARSEAGVEGAPY